MKNELTCFRYPSFSAHGGLLFEQLRKPPDFVYKPFRSLRMFFSNIPELSFKIGNGFA
ncbi:Uncharacterised protein [Klebsiella variicola]|nr:Uncharacterised protein [Klebsiella variicola]SLW73123.1 Uncharacterised protein [Klebsiella variicola]SMA30243.1 Uncharacterised protein [Klebsiella variicola]SMA31513.1 Uncharacterised protein [Klebsiella variicola]SMA33215.1 Uncharacterised protein [Klebsiella variicola]